MCENQLQIQTDEPLQDEQTRIASLIDFLGDSAAVLWKDWPREMKITPLNAQSAFSFNGTCPHPACKRDSVFIQATGIYSEPIGTTARGQIQRIAVGMQCQGCRKFILGVVQHEVNTPSYTYEEHYPLGSPDESVAEEIPINIQSDFKEALRCRWVNAYNATAEMCRRAVESSCIDLGASRKQRFLEDKIDWLAREGKITTFLQQVAHKIRLGGARAAHPPEKQSVPELDEAEAGPFVITEEHADAIIKFTREFFHHVYVVPKQLDKYDFSRAATTKKPISDTPGSQ